MVEAGNPSASSGAVSWHCLVALRYAGAEEWTYANYARMPADSRVYEIHEGVLCTPPWPAT